MVAPPSTGGSAPAPLAGKQREPARMGASSHVHVPPPIPYSARRAPALDLKTVERKSHASFRNPPTRSRPHGLTEAPTFRPNNLEFRDPMAYLQSIYEQASKYGICKIIPPDGWNPDFAVDTERFHFRTRRQTINETDGGNRTNLHYLDQLAKFHRQYGTQLNRFPSVDKRPLDLYKLKKAVEVRGGFEKVCKDKKWAEIGRDLGYSGKIMSSLSTSLKNSYQRWLHPYESWLISTKNGGQPMDFEYHNAAFSPSVPHSQHQSPAHHQSQSAPPTESPAVQASVALNTSVNAPDQNTQSSPAPPQDPARPVSSSGFTAVNHGGFTAVNQTSGFVAVNQQPPPAIKSEICPPAPLAPSYGNGFAAVNGTPSAHAIHDTSPLTNGAFNPLKRTMSHESLNGETGSDDFDEQGRRTKRSRKDGALIPGNHVPSMRPTTPQMKGRSTPRRGAEKCERCGKSDDQANIIVCDSCDQGFHLNCAEPPLAAMPEFEWNCSKCLIGSSDYGFEEGGVYSLRFFQEKANNFKEHYFATRMPFDPVTGTNRRPTEDDVEREFWRLVEDITESVEVEYGADIHSTTHGSGFPSVEKNPLNPYSRDPWNLNVMPFLEESLFRHIKGDISGMTVPWLYVGMCFSTFCWHNEDHYAYSANYQHFGATKTWYGIPGKDAHAFEAAMRKAVPELFESQPDLLFQLVTILPPDQLRKAGVDVFVLDQRAGEFVITFPQAYHAGFNHGFNFNEAVNFAPADWEPFGEAGVQRLREFRKQPCFCHDELLLTAANADASIKTARWLAPALERTRDRELSERKTFVDKHKALHPHDDCTFDTLDTKPSTECGLIIVVENKDLEEEEYQCHHCKAYTFLSQFRCHNSGKVSCLLHPDIVECCPETPEQRSRGSTHSLVVRYTNQELEDIVQKVRNKASVPEVWEAKLEDLLENEARPSLKQMHQLLSEGEKIPFQLSGIDDLRDFVRQCDAWAEEANLYLTRKQQNRRKSEKASRRASTRGKDGDKDDTQLSLERMKKLIDDGRSLGFSATQFDQLQEKLDVMDEWRLKAKPLCSGRAQATLEELGALLDEGRSFLAAMPELTGLERLHSRQQWFEQVDTIRRDMSNQTLDECKAILEKATDLDIDLRGLEIGYMTEIVRQGDFWEIKAKEVMSAQDVHYPQLESLHTQVQNQTFPVNKNTLAQMDAILAKNREAKRQIITLVERSHDPDFRKRPMYGHVRDVVKGLEDLNGKPHGTTDLERELRRQEDWMRKGKKLFGKANAPLHILEQHMKYVEEKNSFCFDLNDTFRPPVEPASREASPTEGHEKGNLGDDEKPVFCICRQPEAGLMIECEICHDWYHAKCLKLARGKVKETEMFTCPICDWRVKIPRDAARPKLEDLQSWQDELNDLPFQPEEEELLKRIVDKAQGFRDFLGNYTNGNQLCRTIEEMPEMLFYLRKIEGAEVLLSYETNLFRQELHKWQPIAPEAPPILSASLSTRKPRPTKQQKLMKELGVEKPEDLPPHLRTKTYTRRKTQDGFAPPGALMPKPSMHSPTPGSASSPGPSHHGQGRSATPAGMPRTASTGNAPSNGAFGTVALGAGANTDGALVGDYASAYPVGYDADAPSPMFSPAGASGPMMAAGADAGTDTADPSFPTFRSSIGMEVDDDLRSGLTRTDSPIVRDSPGSPPQVSQYDDMFMDIGVADGEIEGEGPGANDPVSSLEHEASHASEALEMIASNDEGQREETEAEALKGKREADDMFVLSRPANWDEPHRWD